jgi:hypothetical protein
MRLNDYIAVNGWNFELVVQSGGDDVFYQCRGEVMYDNEHDQIPEPSLWRAAEKLNTILTKDGLNVDTNHSEKGWVEVTINNYKIFR